MCLTNSKNIVFLSTDESIEHLHNSSDALLEPLKFDSRHQRETREVPTLSHESNHDVLQTEKFKAYDIKT